MDESPLGDLVRAGLETDVFFGKVFHDFLAGMLTEEILEKNKAYRLDDGILYYKG